MMVPAHMEKLDEAHITLRQATSQQAVGCVAARAGDIRPVQIQRFPGLGAHIEEVRHTGLHTEGHFVLTDTGVNLGVPNRFLTHAVEGGEAVERIAAGGAIHARRVSEIENRIAFVTELYTLVLARQKARAPQSVVQGLVIGSATAETGEDHIGRQVAVGATQAIAHPGTDARAARELVACLHEGNGGIMVDRLGVDRADHAKVISYPGQIFPGIA